MLFGNFLEKRRLRQQREDLAHALYVAVVKQSRQPIFFTDFEVPDTQEGRYDIIVLHAWMLMRRLGSINGPQKAEAKELGQTTFDVMFADMDRSLREMGITDSGIGRRVKKLAEAFYGRIFAYDQALAEGDALLQAAISRNLYADAEVSVQTLERMAKYVSGQLRTLEAAPDEEYLTGKIPFKDVESLL